MDESASTAPSNSSNESARSSWLTWLLMSVVATAALALIAAHAPARIRLLGLFYVAFGVLIGFGMTRLAHVLDAPVSKWGLALTAAVLTVLGLVGSTLETIRLERAVQSEMTTKEKLQAELQTSGLPIGQDQAGAKLSQGAIQWSVPAKTTLASYLTRRTRPLGSWKTPFPELFWSCEMVVAAIASAWTAFALSKPAVAPVPNDSSVQS